MQIMSFGGPIHQTSVTYAIDNITVATVDQSGLITADELGNAIVTGAALILYMIGNWEMFVLNNYHVTAFIFVCGGHLHNFCPN